MKNSSLIKSIAFILWFANFCPMRYYASTDKNVISTIKQASADFTYRILPADVKPLYHIELEDVQIKIEAIIKSADKIIVAPPLSSTNKVRFVLAADITKVKH